MSETEIILFAVDKDCNVVAGLPPKDLMDSYSTRATRIGRLANVSHISFNPDGQLYAVRGRELYTGPLPSSENQDWFADAKRVGKVNWDNIKFFFFHPKGELYVITNKGELYKGPAPSNENVPWMYRQATKLARSGWQEYDAVFFDPEGALHAVTAKDTLVKGSPPTNMEDNWLERSTKIGTSGWRDLSNFISFSPDGNLWCIDKGQGNIYIGLPPTVEDPGYYAKAKHVGCKYNYYRFYSLIRDKTIQSIVKLEFLPDQGKTVSERLEIVASQNYLNKNSTSPLKCTFTLHETITNTSTFNHEHGFTFGVSCEHTVRAGVPFIADGSVELGVSLSTTNNWSFTETNETARTYCLSTEFEVEPGKDVRQVASVTRAKIIVPYRATVRTLFGYETTICGTWKGATHYNITVKKEDI
ncbi:uncharacterized protein O3C94_021656 [Discoglossus pictus]